MYNIHSILDEKGRELPAALSPVESFAEEKCPVCGGDGQCPYCWHKGDGKDWMCNGIGMKTSSRFVGTAGQRQMPKM